MEPDETKLTSLFNELEFRSLASKFLKKSEAVQKPVNGQLDLFANFTTEDSRTQNFANFETLKTTPHDYKLVDNEEDMRSLCDFF